jgi:hypothetical protein
MTEFLNTSQPKAEDPMASAWVGDENTEMDPLTADGDGHEQQTREGIKTVRVEMNGSTTEQEKTGELNTMAPADVSLQETYHVNVGNRMEQSVCDHGKGVPLAYSGGGNITPPSGERITDVRRHYQSDT